MLILYRLHALGESHDGFTLIEVLVAMVTGVIVTGALFAILTVSITQSSRISDVAQATRLGRTTMTHVVDELHSACLGPNFVPIQAGSGESTLIFIDGYSQATEVQNVATSAVGGRKDEIIYNKAAGTLIDKTYYATGGTSPNFTFSATATPSSGVLIGEKLTQSEVAGKPIPVFKYYEYAAATSTATNEASSTLKEIAPAASYTQATTEKAASVVISFRTAPTSGKTAAGRSVNFASQTTLSFSVPSSETPVQAAPCQ